MTPTTEMQPRRTFSWLTIDDEKANLPPCHHRRRSLLDETRISLFALEQSQDPVNAVFQRAMAGDRAASNRLTQAVLMPAIDAAVSRYLFGAGRQRFDKEDVAQEVLAHLYENQWEKLRHFDSNRGSLTTYVWGVVRNWIRDHSRREMPPVPVENPEEGIQPDSGPEGKAQLAQIMEKLMASLDEEQVLLFQWVHFQGLEREEIAARLEISMEAAYKRIQRMEAHVKAALSAPELMGKGEKARPS